MYLFIYSSLHVSNMSCSSSEETNCINTASGNCHSVLVAVKGVGLPPTSIWHCHQHGVTITRSCIDTICFSWWRAWHARNMWRTI